MFKSIFGTTEEEAARKAAKEAAATLTLVQKAQDVVVVCADETGYALRNGSTYTHHVVAAFFGGFTRKANGAQVVIEHYRKEVIRK